MDFLSLEVVGTQDPTKTATVEDTITPQRPRSNVLHTMKRRK